MTHNRRLNLRVAVVAASALLFLAFSALWVAAPGVLSAQAVEPGQSIPPLPTITLTKTVGIESESCATSSTLLVPTNTVVYYCYQVENTSIYVLPFHQLFDDGFAQPIFPDGFAYDLQPEEIINTVEMGIPASRIITDTVKNVAQWLAYVNDDLYAEAIATATVTVVTPQIALNVRAGRDDGCNGSNPFPGFIGTPYSWCVTLTNSGEITLTEHAINIPSLSLTITRTETLTPGASLTITRAEEPALGPHILGGNLTITANATSTHVEASVPFTATTSTTASLFAIEAEAWLPLIERD